MTSLFRAHYQKVSKTHYSSAKHRRPHCKQDQRSSLPCSAVWSTRHPTSGDPTDRMQRSWYFSSYQLAGSSLSRKHGLANFFHKRLRYTLLDQSPLTSEIDRFCVDVDGYKIVNVYKPPTMRLRSLDLPVFPHPFFMLAILTLVMLIGVTSPDGECFAGWASINNLALPYIAKFLLWPLEYWHQSRSSFR